MYNIAIFASGSGTNTKAIIEYFSSKNLQPVKLILSNNKDAFVLQRAKQYNIKGISFNREIFYKTNVIAKILEAEKIDFIVLAGFMWLVPIYLLQRYRNKIINIHPALLPKFGGKGMYGMHVHEAVIAKGEKESGITIHYVNDEYDKGKIILQVKCFVQPDDTAESLAQKVHELEYEHYPKVIESIIK